MKNKLLISMLILFLPGLSNSLGTESQNSLSFSEWRKKSLALISPHDDNFKEEMDHVCEVLVDRRARLDGLEQQWQLSDDTWRTLEGLENGTNDKSFPPRNLNLQAVCTQHEALLWKMIDLNDEIEELKQRESVLKISAGNPPPPENESLP